MGVSDFVSSILGGAAGPRADVAATLDGAAADPDFRSHVARGDAARDAGDWVAAEDHYARALGAWPLHSGYRIQLGHMLKEQGRFPAAELQYRTAWALGEASADLRHHLRFVCEAQGARWAEPRTPARSDKPLGRAPTAMDIEALAYLFWGEPAGLEEPMLAVMRSAPTVEAAAIAMIRDTRFSSANGPLLDLMAEQE